MASLATARGGTPGSASKQIPLLCTVCPDAPRFSDVSHLLTHIASKGHLHHETQTRLKSHQDLAATVLLQQYENWYKDNGIEALLVERMKAKQLKEAAKTRRGRGATPLPSLNAKRKTKRPPSAVMVKSEHDDFAQDFPLFPGFFASDNDVDIQDDFFVSSNDMLSLKGQVWPGMGKMDLANEDMKRTRNQRKPNSVIEKMRRTSEGIEPTQVVMTSDLEVERVKGVYDSSSPILGQGEESPKKASRPKRKRPEPLAEISANIPRGGARRPGRNMAKTNRVPRLKLDYDRDSRDTSSDQTPSLASFRHGHDLFQDDDGASSGIFEDRSFSTPVHQDQKYDSRDRLGLHPLNPISHSNVASPTPSSRDMPTRLLSARDSNRGRTQAHGYLGHGGHMTLGSLAQPETPYGIGDPTMYGTSARLSFTANNHFGAIAQEPFRLNPSHHQPKHGDFASTAGDSLANSNGNQFLTMSESNPLFSHDRMFLSSYSQPHTSQSLSSLSFTPINRGRDHSLTAHDHERRASGPSIKAESQLCEGVDSGSSCDAKQTSFTVNGLWDPQASDSNIDIQEDLGEELDI